jgi:hypothetical protein
MAEIRTGRAGEPSTWSTRDLMVIAAIGVALGVVLVPVIYATGCRRSQPSVCEWGLRRSRRAFAAS